MVEGGHPYLHVASTSPFNIDHAYGGKNDAIEYVTQLQSAGADEIMCIMQMGGVPHEAADGNNPAIRTICDSSLLR